MDQAIALRSTLASFLGVGEAALTSDFSLGATKLKSSIQRAMLYAQLKAQAGVIVRGMPAFKTVGDMEAQLLGKVSVASATAPTPATTVRTVESSDSTVACGIDIESVSALPKPTDYWDHAFYQSHFTKEEIAYCLLQGEPAVHLAGRWCVKEALKKCDPAFVVAAMNEIEVRTDAAGAPAVWDVSNGAARKLPYAVSLSHSADYAVGTVVRVNIPAPLPSAPVAVVATPVQASGRAGKMLGAVAVLISLVALVVSVAAALKTH